MAEILPTSERLARDLEAAGAPALMVERARAKVYDEDDSSLLRPLHELHTDLLRAGLDNLARDVRNHRWDS